MRFTITPLGAAGGRTVAAVARDIVCYLSQPQPAAGGHVAEQGVGAYYGDGSQEPGHWLGAEAAAMGLDGEVAPTDFAQVLAGRDPRTGVRLVGAEGSAGRVAALGVGTVSRFAPDGEAVYGVRDTAAVVGLEVEAVVNSLKAVNIGVQHGPHKSWLPVPRGQRPTRRSPRPTGSGARAPI